VRTRERLLDAAEQLWGERGVDGVSLREIRIAAGQRNSSALQFHFGDRDGLLLALARRHLPRIAALYDERYAAAVAAGRQDEVAALVEVLVGPHADYLRLGPSERAWIKISAQQGGSPRIALGDIVEHAPPVALQVGTELHRRLSATMDADVVTERLISVTAACSHLCADRARLEELLAQGPATAGLRPSLPFEQWRANLFDMAVGALLAPSSRHPS
jgi:AcrR family transcriptional regulator